jgi:hypothetical protein
VSTKSSLDEVEEVFLWKDALAKEYYEFVLNILPPNCACTMYERTCEWEWIRLGSPALRAVSWLSCFTTLVTYGVMRRGAIEWMWFKGPKPLPSGVAVSIPA